MKKKIAIIAVSVIALILIGIITGVIPFTVQLKDFFFSTEYYNTPVEAYNAENSIDATFGDISAKSEIGLFKLDSENALFLGDLSNGFFVVAEMKIKDNKYAYAGTRSVYEIQDDMNVNGKSYDRTKIAGGYVKWSIVYKESDIEKFDDVTRSEHYKNAEGRDIFLVLSGEGIE
ncbi:MAG: hypothetical protein J5662_00720 [Clostridia bacterium]|nr:hypothetical protein [Clostridia bacterium]